MERLKEKLKICRSEVMITSGRIMNGDIMALTRAERMIVVAAGFVLGMILIAAQSPAFAGGDIVDQAENMAKQYYSSLFVIVPVVAALFLLLAILWAMVVPTNQGARKPIEWGTRILICLIIACSIGGLVALVNNLTNGLNFTP